MGMFGNLFANASAKARAVFNDLANDLNALMADTKAMNRFAAAAVEVSRADGDMSAEERQEFIGLVEKVCGENFDRQQLRASWEAAVGRSYDQNMALISKASEAEAAKIVRGICRIANADDDFDASEQKVVRDVCDQTWLNPKDFAQFGLK